MATFRFYTQRGTVFDFDVGNKQLIAFDLLVLLLVRRTRASSFLADFVGYFRSNLANEFNSPLFVSKTEFECLLGTLAEGWTHFFHGWIHGSPRVSHSFALTSDLSK